MEYKMLTFHFIALAHHVHTIKYTLFNLDFSKITDHRVLEVEEFGPRYITSWNLAIQTTYLILAILLDLKKIFSFQNKSPEFWKILETYTGYLYTVILFPTTLLVAFMFWTLYSINREWVFPAAADAVAPFWLNHSLHTIILFVIIFETFLRKETFPEPPFKIAFFILLNFCNVYFIQFIEVYFQSGRWIYSVYYDLNWPGKIALFGFKYFISLVFLWIGYNIQKWKRGKAKSV